METNPANEIILYLPDDTLALDVRVEDESVSLSRNLEFAGLLLWSSAMKARYLHFIGV